MGVYESQKEILAGTYYPDLILLGALVMLSQGSAVAPFVYTLF